MIAITRRHLMALVGAAAAAPGIATAQSSATPVAVASPVATSAVLKATYTLSDIPLSQFQNEVLPEFPIANDRGFLIGGVGSDIFHVPGTDANILYMVTDRGPNGTVTVGDEDRTTFPVPDFTPTIFQIMLEGDEITIVEAFPLVGASGAPVTGLANTDLLDAPPWYFTGEAELPYNPSGLDTEGLVLDADGTFWLSEEYSPSIVHVDAIGTVIARYVPAGLDLTEADYEVIDSLPAIYADRRSNRGFEGLAISGDSTTVFAALQSPLYVPDAAAGKASLTTRILAFDTSTGLPVAEYAYQFDDITTFDPTAEGATDLMKLSGIAWVNDTTMLVIERTDPVAKIYAVDLATATNLLGDEYDDPTLSPSLEQLNDLTVTSVVPVAKSLIVDLSTLAAMPTKIEGVAILDDITIAVANDNDFDINEFDADGNTISTGRQSQIFVIELATPLGIAW